MASGASPRHCPPALNANRMQRPGCRRSAMRKKSAVGADLRQVFDGVFFSVLGGAHRRTKCFSIDGPDVHPVGVILSGRIDQALAVPD